MLRFYFVVIISFPSIVYYIIKARIRNAHKEHYTEEKNYRLIRRLSVQCMVNSNVWTKYTGAEKLPKKGGYILYPNHQGRYDIVGIFYSHKKPLTLVMESERSKIPIATEVMDLLDGVRLDRHSMRNQVDAVERIAKEVSEGRRYVIFPEGGYDNNGNNLQRFMPGAFKAAVKAKCPIVPVTLVDSYKPYSINSLRRIKTQVHFLDPIPYEEYKDMNTCEIAALVKSRIQEKMDSVT